MFGYLVAAPELMTEPQLGRYRAAYCGLCRSLRARHGQISGLTLTYDMTFLVLFLSSLYEPEEITGEDTCAVHPFKAREWVRNAAWRTRNAWMTGRMTAVSRRLRKRGL